MECSDFGEYHKVIETKAQRSAVAIGRQKGNIEDQIRVANELLRGFQIIANRNNTSALKADNLSLGIANVISSFADSIYCGENGIASADTEKQRRAFNYLVSFLMSFASRSGTRERLHIFTTNYDRFIEAGAEEAGMYLLDRFVGTLRRSSVPRVLIWTCTIIRLVFEVSQAT